MIRVRLRDLGPEARKQVRQVLRSSKKSTPPRSAVIEERETTSKMRNVRTTVDGITFASKREANRYAELRLELRASEITDLELQRPFSLDVNGFHVCDYVANFVYGRNGVQIVEDAKGKRTDVYVIKRALMRAVYGIEIVEV
jgi:hypothetical protein